MAYLIDSDWVIDYLDQRPEALELFTSFGNEGVYVSIVTYMEVFQGTLREADATRARDTLNRFLDSAPLLPFSQNVAERCARIREAVRGGRVRTNRRAFDLMIAATAIEHGLTLVTRNVDDFADVPELVLHRP